MKYKGILLDIDNTLYEYERTHRRALDVVMSYCDTELGIPKQDSLNAYEASRKNIHYRLTETASSHNRLLYIQGMLEMLRVNSTKYSLAVYELYWSTFLDNIIVFEGVYKFLEMYKNKICLVTDLTAHIQHRKVKKLKLDDYLDLIVTSEEVGREKPHSSMFLMALEKLGLKASDVCMVGDSFKKDILGAADLGIKSIWFNHENKNEKYNKEWIEEIKVFGEILELI